MGTSTLRHVTPQRLPASTYWRRRFVTLVVGISVLAFIGWALSGSFRGSSSGSPGTAGAGDYGHFRGPAAGAPGGARSGGASSPTVSDPSLTASPRATDAGHTGGVLPCPSGSVILSLFSSQGTYSAGQVPQFEVDVVSTAAQNCTFDVGSRHVLLTITAGSARIWSSGDCQESRPSLVTELMRGVPKIIHIGWHGGHATLGCPAPRPSRSRRSYTAVATDGSLRSSPVVFRLH